MISVDLFDAMMQALEDVHHWRPMGDVAKNAMIKQLNKYGVDEQDFGEHCLKVLGTDRLQRANIVEYFQALYLQDSRQKALPEASVSPDIQSDEFIRFVRMNRDLRAALAQGKTYPTDKAEFHELWRRPLTEADREDAAQRRESRRLQVMGIEIPVGGTHALN